MNLKIKIMTLKTINLLYWIFTIIFAALMIFSSVGGVEPTPQAVQLIHDGLGYPVYFIQFISIAKLIGVAVILIPGIKNWIKDWAYAGLFFDLAGAIYSGIAAFKFDPLMLTMLIWILPGILSYHFWRKKNKEKTFAKTERVAV